MASMEDLYNHPDFKKLDWENQKYVISRFQHSKLQNNPEFQQMDQVNKAYVMNHYLTQAKPAFEDPDNPYVQQSLQLAEGIRAGDEEAQNAALGEIGKDAFMEQMSIIKAAQWVGEGIVEFVDPQALEAFERERAQETSQDALKARRYMEESFPLVGEAKALRSRKNWSTLGGAVADFASWTAITQPFAAAGKLLLGATKAGKALGISAGKFVGAGKALKGPWSRWFWQSAVPETAFNMRGGAIGILRENIMGNVEEKLGEDPEFFDYVWENSKVFGEYFLWDMVAFAGLQLAGAGVKFGAVAGKNVGKKIMQGSDVLDEETYGRLLKEMVTTGGVPAEDLAKMPRKKREAFERIALMRERGTRVGKMSDQEKLLYFAQVKGFDIAQDGNKWTIKDVADETEKIHTVDTFEEAFRRTIELGEERFSFKGSKTAAGDLLGGSTDVKVTEIISADTKGLNLNPKGMNNLLKPRGNKVPLNNVKEVTHDIAVKSGIKPDSARRIPIVEVDDYFTPGRKLQSGVIEVPKSVTKPSEHKKFVRNYLKQMEDVVTTQGGSKNPLAEMNEAFIREAAARPMSPMFVRDLAKRVTNGGYIRKVGTQWELVTKSGREAVGDFDSIGRYLVRNYVAPQSGKDYVEMVRGHVYREFGGRVNVNPETGTIKVVRKTGPGPQQRTLEEYSGLDEMLNKHPEYTPKMPMEAMPDINITTKTASRFEIDAGAVRGDRKQIIEFMNNFSDDRILRDEVAIKMGEGNIATFNRVKRKFRVEMPETGVKRTFNKLEDAKEWLRKGVKNFDDVEMNARYKGMRVETAHNGFLIWDGAEKHFASTLDEAKGIIKEMPTPEWVGKELSGMRVDEVDGLAREFREFIDDSPAFTESIDEITAKMIKHAKKMNPNIEKMVDAKPGVLTNYLQLVAPTQDVIQRMVKETGNDSIYTLFKGVEDGRQLFEGAFASFKKFYKRSIGRLTDDEDKLLNQILQSGVDETQWNTMYKKIAQTSADIPDNLSRALSRTRDVLGRSPEDGLFAMTGMDGYKFLTDYWARIKAAIPPDGSGTGSSVAGSVQKALGLQKLPPEMKFFFENMRMNDLLHFRALDSMEEVMDFYARKVFQKVHLDKPVKQLRKALNDGTITGTPRDRLELYITQVQGVHSSATDLAMQAATKDLSYKALKNLESRGLIKGADKKYTDDLIGFFNGLTIAATMSYRAWMPIRNLHQPMLTVGSRFGLDVTWEGYKRAIKNAEDIVPRLKARGVIPDKAPIMEMISATKFQKFNHIGMKLYQDADAFNRAVSDQVAEALMGDSARRFVNGWIDEKQFIKMAKLDLIDDLGRREVLGALKNGEFLHAQDLFSRRIIYETQFPYKAGTNPTLFEGTIGRIFGGFGHYPINFVANLVKGVTTGPVSNRFATAGRYLAVMYGLKKAWEVVDVDARNFVWNTPIQFEGGPYYQLFNTALKTTDMESYEGQRARGEIKRTLPRLFFPAYGAISSQFEALEDFSNGDKWGGIMNMLSLPVSDTYY